MDRFKEDIVVRRNPLLPNMLYMACWFFLVALGLYALVSLQFVFIQFSVLSILRTLIAAGSAVLLFLYKDELKVEYEYTFTNGTLDFAKVLRSVRRKELGSMNVANLSACGHVAHSSFSRYLSMKEVERKNWFLNRDSNLFYFFYEKEGKRHLIVIEPSEEMVELIRPYLSAGVYQG